MNLISRNTISWKLILRNNKKQPNGDTIYATINKDLSSVTMEKSKELSAILLGKENF